MQYQVTATIVTYNNDKSILLKTINSFLFTSLNVKLFIVDNSPSTSLKDLCVDKRIEYFSSGCNKGFGAGHNIILKQYGILGKYHIVLNPDIYFEKGQLEKMVDYMDKNSLVGLLMPKIIYPNGNLQYLCKLLPTPRDWIFRRFLSFLPTTQKRDEMFELRFTKYDKEMNIPYLSGSFMFLRSSIIEEIGLFDEGIFMYGEDTDLSRRIHKRYKTIFFPEAVVTHEFQKASHKSVRLLWIHIKAAIYYFNKWGWLFDKDRSKINNRVLKELGYDEY